MRGKKTPPAFIASDWIPKCKLMRLIALILSGKPYDYQRDAGPNKRRQHSPIHSKYNNEPLVRKKTNQRPVGFRQLLKSRPVTFSNNRISLSISFKKKFLKFWGEDLLFLFAGGKRFQNVTQPKTPDYRQTMEHLWSQHGARTAGARSSFGRSRSGILCGDYTF